MNRLSSETKLFFYQFRPVYQRKLFKLYNIQYLWCDLQCRSIVRMKHHHHHLGKFVGRYLKWLLMYFIMRSVLGRNLHADQNLWIKENNRELNFSERLFSRKPLISHEKAIWRFYCISLLTDLLYYFYWLIYESYSVIRKPVIFFHRNQISHNEN